MSQPKKYGQQRRSKKTQKGKYFVMVLAGLAAWALVICSWTTQRLAALCGYQPELGQPLFEAGGRLWYGPWKLVEWAEALSQYEAAKRVLDQGYLAGMGGLMLVFMVYLITQNGLKGREDLHGSAKWAAYKDIKKMDYLKGEGVYVGGWFDEKKSIHHYLRHDGPEHVLCFAPTRSGKGVGLILPTLLSWEHSTVVLDIKGENFALTSGYLKSLGHNVVRFDPSDASGASAAFNPLAEIRLNSPDAISDVQQISEMVMDSSGKGLDDYWGKAGFGFFGGALLHCLIKTLHEQQRPANLYDLALMLEDPARPVKAVFEEMLEMDHAAILSDIYPALAKHLGQAAHQFVASAARGMLSKADSELSGVVNTATANLSLYKNPVVAMNTSRSDFHINDLMNHDQPVNLYLVIPPGSINTLRPLLRIIITLFVGRLIERMDFEDGASVARYHHKLLMMLDEFTSLGRLPVMEKGIAYVAGYGIKLYIIVQDTKQLTEVYGQNNTFFPNCRTRIAYAPNQPETAEFLSKLAGTTTVVDQKLSLSKSRGGGSRSYSMAETSRPLITPDECMTLPGMSKDDKDQITPGDMLIFTSGNSPIYGRQILYFLDPVFRERAKVKAPGVSPAWPAGISDSLYFSMPLFWGGEEAQFQEVVTDLKDAKPILPDGPLMPEDIAYEYQKYLEV